MVCEPASLSILYLYLFLYSSKFSGNNTIFVVRQDVLVLYLCSSFFAPKMSGNDLVIVIAEVELTPVVLLLQDARVNPIGVVDVSTSSLTLA